MAPLVGECLPGTQPVEDLDELLKPGGPARGVHPGGLPLPPLSVVECAADSYGQHQAASGYEVQGPHLVGQEHRVPQGRQHYSRTQPDSAGAAGYRRQGGQGLQPGLGGEAVPYPHRVQPGLVRSLGHGQDGLGIPRPVS